MRFIDHGDSVQRTAPMDGSLIVTHFFRSVVAAEHVAEELLDLAEYADFFGRLEHGHDQSGALATRDELRVRELGECNPRSIRTALLRKRTGTSRDS
jgi:hypothetical protein